jgi:hypothetical protein
LSGVGGNPRSEDAAVGRRRELKVNFGLKGAGRGNGSLTFNRLTFNLLTF